MNDFLINLLITVYQIILVINQCMYIYIYILLQEGPGVAEMMTSLGKERTISRISRGL